MSFPNPTWLKSQRENKNGRNLWYLPWRNTHFRLKPSPVLGEYYAMCRSGKNCKNIQVNGRMCRGRCKIIDAKFCGWIGATPDCCSYWETQKWTVLPARIPVLGEDHWIEGRFRGQTSLQINWAKLQWCVKKSFFQKHIMWKFMNYSAKFIDCIIFLARCESRKSLCLGKNQFLMTNLTKFFS